MMRSYHQTIKTWTTLAEKEPKPFKVSADQRIQSDHQQNFCIQPPVDQTIGPRVLALSTVIPLNCATKDGMASFCRLNISNQQPRKQSLLFAPYRVPATANANNSCYRSRYLLVWKRPLLGCKRMNNFTHFLTVSV